MTANTIKSETELERPGRDRRSVPDMLGEVLREAGVLLFVFIPLDLVIQGHGLTIAWVTAILTLPAAFLVAGIYVERTRTK
jgi:hypothetical protein